ncbi:type VI secretion system lipoprotein TssJ [Enterobacter asburiae]|uniref:type VI secretion system lipoprotein TssJ n=1 Tax=Enterobacteriaceae TaxID=543 RepID=UPI002FC84B9A
MRNVAGQKIALMLLLSLSLGGCTTMGKMVKVAANPDIQVGSDGSQPSTVSFSLVGEAEMNPGESGDASPVEFQIVMLAEDSRLLASDYDQVTADLPKALAKNYLDHQDYTLLPGQFKYLPAVELDNKTRYIGVIAHYADPDSAQWRKVIPVKSTGRHYQVLVHLRRDEVDLQPQTEE